MTRRELLANSLMLPAAFFGPAAWTQSDSRSFKVSIADTPLTDESEGVLVGGALRVDITPPANVVSTWGYGGPNSKPLARGSLDPLYAHILYLKVQNGTGFVWVDLDCGRTPGIPSQNQIRRSVAEVVPHVGFSATHTHSGPFFLDDFSNAVVPDWEQEMLDRIAKGIRNAAKAAVPVRLRFSSGSAVIGYNRRLVHPDGSITMLAGIDGNRDGSANGPIDPAFAALRIDAENGEPIAIISNATAHPVIRKERDMFSADYPGVVRQVVSDGFVSRPVCLFLQGAAGDINPQRPLGANLQEEDGVQQLGRLLGEKVLAAVRLAPPAEAEVRPSIAILDDHVKNESRWPNADFNKTFADYRGYVDHVRLQEELPIMAILLNRKIAWVSFPGELFVQLQLYLRTHSPLRNILIAGYSNGYFGYFPTIEAAATGGYGANNIMAAVAPGTGEALVNRALIDIDVLLGRLRDTPAQPTGPNYDSTWD